MISWIQRTFQRHFRIVFLLVLIVIAVPLVFIYRTGANGGGDRQVLARDFFDYNLSSPDDERRLMGDARISVELQSGAASLDEDQLKTYALQRAAALYLAKTWRLPPATSAQVAGFIKGLRIFADDKGQFDAARYAAFRDSLRLDPNVSESDIARVIGDDVRAAQVEQLLGGPGYVLPGDVASQLLRSDTRWTIATATIDYRSFDPAIHPTDAELQRYFAANAFRYEIPPRVVAGYVNFPAAEYERGVTVTEAEARAAFDADPSRFAPPATKAPVVKLAAAPPKADFAAVRPQVEAALRLQHGRDLAAQAGADFVYALYDGKIAAGPALDAFLAAHRTTLQPLAPFTEEAGPAELGGAHDISEAAFQLTPQRYYSDALPTARGAVVLIWKELQPARQPLFIEVRAKVLADYVDNEKRQRFVDLGRTLRGAIEARLKAGDSFAKAAVAAAAAAGVKVDVKTLPPFTFRSPPADLNSTVAGALEHLAKGQVSDLVVATDQGYLVYALDVKAPDLREINPLYAETRAELAAYQARLGAAAALSELVEQELKRTEPAEK